jgi:chromosome segregation ATPase
LRPTDVLAAVCYRLEADLADKEKAANDERSVLKARENQLMADVSRLSAGLDRMREEEQNRKSARERGREEEREMMARLRATLEADQREHQGEQSRLKQCMLEQEEQVEALKRQVQGSEAQMRSLQGELSRLASEAAFKEDSLQKQHTLETQAKELVWQHSCAALKADMKRVAARLGLLCSCVCLTAQSQATAHRACGSWFMHLAVCPLRGPSRGKANKNPIYPAFGCF